MITQQNKPVPVDNNIAAHPMEQEEGFANVQNVANFLHVPDATVEAWIKQRDVEAKRQLHKESHQLPYPTWPTSQPGPQATPPPSGQDAYPLRSDQMVYECYDQERGVPCIAVPEAQPSRSHPLEGMVAAGQQVYDTRGERVGKITVRFPHYLLVERGLIFRRTYYVPLWLVERVEDERVRLAVSEATLVKQGYASVPGELYRVPRPSSATAFPDISDASLLGKYPPTPAETGHYHYGPLEPGINTDAGGSYAPHEIDPYGRPVDRPAKLYSTGKQVSRRSL